jgi:hypothetical protein
MPVPKHLFHPTKPELGYASEAYTDPAWADATTEEIVYSEVAGYLISKVHVPRKPGKSTVKLRREEIEFIRSCLREEIEFFRNAKPVLSKPKIMLNTTGMKIPGDESGGFSFNPGVVAKHGSKSLPIISLKGLFYWKYSIHNDVVVGWAHDVPPEIGNPEWATLQFRGLLQRLMTAAARENIDRFHAAADPIIEKRLSESPAMLREYVQKHSGNHKVAEQLSGLIYSNGWHDKDPESLFAILDFCKDNTNGIRNFSTWVRTHKAQIKLLDLETVKRAIVLANVKTVNEQ